MKKKLLKDILILTIISVVIIVGLYFVLRFSITYNTSFDPEKLYSSHIFTDYDFYSYFTNILYKIGVFALFVTLPFVVSFKTPRKISFVAIVILVAYNIYKQPLHKTIYFLNDSNTTKTITINNIKYSIYPDITLIPPYGLKFSDKPVNIDGKIIKEKGTYLINLNQNQFILYSKIENISPNELQYDINKWNYSSKKITHISNSIDTDLDIFFSFPYDDMKEFYLIKAVNKSNPKYTLKTAYYKKSCENGNAKDCYILANRYDKALFVNQDYKKAFFYYKKACDKGILKACFKVASFYFNGFGVKQDYKKALNIYKKACENGEKESCYNLGVLYENGEAGLESNFEIAKKYFFKACGKNGCIRYHKAGSYFRIREIIEEHMKN